MRRPVLAVALLAAAVIPTAGRALAEEVGAKQRAKLPNIVWITCEDMGPHLGCYGDTYAVTPNLDRFAKKALRYLHVWSNAPVCAPSRTCIITGMYATSTGSEHMRSQTRLPQGIDMYPVLLRRLGYYCTNRVKEDYNLVQTGKVWDESSNKAHWKNRKPGQPFFAVFNFTVTHESQIRKRPHKLVHDPQKVTLPPYHPDTPEVRHDWAQYYDNITTMDRMVGQILQELEDAGLLDDTIIFFYSDHGSGMPRSKRHPTNSGLHVPLLVYVPERYRDLAPRDYRPGGTTDRLVGFVDLAPTLLSIAGERPAKYHQGHAFMGKYLSAPPPYLFGFRGRMDERPDMARSVRDQRYVYVRNYHPHKPYGQHLAYQFETPTTRVWKQLFDAGKLNEVQSIFWKTKPAEELYDLQADPHEVKNLIDSPEHKDILQRFRKAHQEHVFKIRDVGFLPEPEIHSRAKGSTPYQVGHDPKKYALERIFGMAEVATLRSADTDPQLLKGLSDGDSAVRYWAVMGLLVRGRSAVEPQRDRLHAALKDSSPSVRIAAAEALGKHGAEKDLAAALPVLLELGNPAKNDVHVCIMALNVIDDLGEKARPAAEAMRTWPREVQNSSDPRSNYGVPRLIDRIRARFSKQDS